MFSSAKIWTLSFYFQYLDFAIHKINQKKKKEKKMYVLILHSKVGSITLNIVDIILSTNQCKIYHIPFMIGLRWKLKANAYFVTFLFWAIWCGSRRDRLINPILTST